MAKSLDQNQTLCLNCIHANGVTKDAIWYDCYCHHPKMKRREGQDPVTGRKMFVTISNGKTCLTDEEYPHCRDINDGNCIYHEDPIANIRVQSL